MNMPLGQQIFIYDHPESKIRFLEMSLHEQDWRATVVYPTNDPSAEQNIQVTENELKKRNYVVKRGADIQGNATLEIHHIGKNTDIKDVFQEAGLTKGAAQLIAHPDHTLATPLHWGKKGLEWSIGSLHDPARMNGIVNTAAELFMVSAGKGAQYGKFSDAKNFTLSLAGLNWLAQSLTYIFFAKTNEERASDKIETKLEKTLKNGGDITQIKYDHTQDVASDALLPRFLRFMRHYPVQIGAILNNLGMVSYIGHAFLERKHHKGQLAAGIEVENAIKYVGDGGKGITNFIKTGFGKDIIGASLSLIGWSILLIPKKEKKEGNENTPSTEQPGLLERGWENFREHTPTIAGLVTLGASSFRLMGATSKGNKMQQIGERIYIGGDIALMFTDSHQYGGTAKLNPEKLTTDLMHYMGNLPVLLGDQAQQTMVDHVVQYWLDKQQSDKTHHGGATHEESATEFKQTLMRKVHFQQAERVKHMHEICADMIGKFAPEQQSKVAESLAASLSTMPWIRASSDEIKHAITNLDPTTHCSDKPLTMNDIAEDVGKLMRIVPGIDTATSTAKLYDAIAPFLTMDKQTTPRPNAIINNAAQLATMIPHELAAQPIATR